MLISLNWLKQYVDINENINDLEEALTMIGQEVEAIDEKGKFLDKVYDVYKKYDGLQLSAKTHQPNTPWTITWNKLINGSGEVDFTIPNELIKNYYKQLASK